MFPRNVPEKQFVRAFQEMSSIYSYNGYDSQEESTKTYFNDINYAT